MPLCIKGCERISSDTSVSTASGGFQRMKRISKDRKDFNGFHLFRREESDGLSVLLDGHSHLGEDGFPLVPDGLGPAELLLPGLVQLCSSKDVTIKARASLIKTKLT